MCFGGGSTSALKPKAATVFDYGSTAGDTSNRQRVAASTLDSTQGDPAAFGSELSGGASPTSAGSVAGMRR